MAYVICVIAHPDHDEPFITDKPGLAPAHLTTLLLEGGQWKVHRVGGNAVATIHLGKTTSLGRTPLIPPESAS